MNQTMIIVILLITVLCTELGQGLQCYQHGFCLGQCPTLSSSIVQCPVNQNRCWKFSTPAGTQRGCGDDRCKVQIDTGILGTANICCSTDLCNSAVKTKTRTMAVIFSSLIAFLYGWCIIQ